jgi:Spy/CpxP family protein refolding chaperone
MKRTNAVVAGLVAGVALAVAAATYAQPFGGMGPGFGAGMGMGPWHGPMAGADHAAVVDSHLSDTKTLLKISTAQEAAWQAFAAAAKQQAASMQAMRAQMWDSTGTAPERMAQRAAAMQQRSAGMAAMADAFSALYAVLTPEQKAIADQNVGMIGHRGMGYGRRAG